MTTPIYYFKKIFYFFLTFGYVSTILISSLDEIFDLHFFNSSFVVVTQLFSVFHFILILKKILQNFLKITQKNSHHIEWHRHHHLRPIAPSINFSSLLATTPSPSSPNGCRKATNPAISTNSVTKTTKKTATETYLTTYNSSSSKIPTNKLKIKITNNSKMEPRNSFVSKSQPALLWAPWASTAASSSPTTA